MKVTVTKFLYVRVGAPSLNAPRYQYLAPGSELEVEDKLYDGSEFEGSKKWLKDDAGNYYWAGGTNYDLIPAGPVAEPPAVDFKEYIKAKYVQGQLTGDVDYNTVLNISNDIKSNKGKGVRIGIVDHNIINNIPVNNIERFSDVTKPAKNHGNAMATIIAGSGKISGIASKSIVVEMPLYDKFGVRREGLIRNIINHIKGQGQNNFILNVSQSFLKDEFTDILKELIALKNVVVIAAAGTDEELLKPNLQYPADWQGVIAVGSITKTALGGAVNPRLDFIVPELEYVAYSSQSGNYKAVSGDSSACAVVSAIAGLLYSSGKPVSFTPAALISSLNELAVPFSQITTLNNLTLIKP